MRLGMIVFAAGMAVGLAFSPAQAQENAEITDVFKTPLAVADAKEVTVRHYNVPPGWTTPKHYHTGHVLLYVLDGSGAMEVDGEVRTGKSGEVIQSVPEKVMVMRNASKSEWLKFVLFQVGAEGAPLIIKAEVVAASELIER